MIFGVSPSGEVQEIRALDFHSTEDFFDGPQTLTLLDNTFSEEGDLVSWKYLSLASEVDNVVADMDLAFVASFDGQVWIPIRTAAPGVSRKAWVYRGFAGTPLQGFQIGATLNIGVYVKQGEL